MPKALMKPLTSQQKAFLDILKGEARGDLRLAKDLAGYAPTTALSDIVRPLKDHILEAIKDVLISGGIKAAFAIEDVIDSPATMGAANKLKAAEGLLDRIGVVKPEEETKDTNKSAIFILPPKGIQNIQIEDGKVTIDTSGSEPELISIDAEPNPS